MGKKVDTKDLVEKIDRITQKRMAENKVVSLEEFRRTQVKPEHHRLLIIDDDETMRKALRRIFEAEGYLVTTAADGTQLSNVLDEIELDLILLDVGLPWINGLELCQLMKEHEQLQEIPIVMISGRTSELDVKRGFDAGANDYVKKPFDVDAIKKTVNTLLQLNK